MAGRLDSETDRSETGSTRMPSKYVSTPRKRPSTAHSSPHSSLLHSPHPYSPSCFIQDTPKPPKTDLMAQHARIRQQWERYSLLAHDSKEGRKFNLADHLHAYAPTFVAKRKGVQFSYNHYVPPHEKRRDRLRFLTRMEMMKGKTAIAGKRT